MDLWQTFHLSVARTPVLFASMVSMGANGFRITGRQRKPRSADAGIPRFDLEIVSELAKFGRQRERRCSPIACRIGNDSVTNKLTCRNSGAAGQDRTVDLVITNDALYH